MTGRASSAAAGEVFRVQVLEHSRFAAHCKVMGRASSASAILVCRLQGSGHSGFAAHREVTGRASSAVAGERSAAHAATTTPG